MGPVKTIFAGIVVIMMIVVSLIIIYFYMKPKKKSHPKAPPAKKELDLNSRYGEGSNYSHKNGHNIADAVTCDSLESAFFNKKCICKGPFFGPDCSEESFDPNYYDVGTTDFAGSTINMNRMSFPYTYSSQSPFNEIPQTFCTKACDKDPSCVGVYYKLGDTMGVKDLDSTCGLLSDVQIRDKKWSYKSDAQGTFFLKKSAVPTFTKQAVVYTELPERYWIKNTESSFILESNVNLIQLKKGKSPTFPLFAKADVPGKFVFSSQKNGVTETAAGPTTRVYVYTDTTKPIAVNFADTTWTLLYGAFFPQ